MDGAVGFVRGAALVLLAMVASGCGPVSDWFWTPDQQGRYWLARDEPLRAARSFEDPLWKGLAYYQAGAFASSSAALAPLETAAGRFRYANALAQQERLSEAMTAYQQALKLAPNFAEAKFNLAWLAGLVELDRKKAEDAGDGDGPPAAGEFAFDEQAAAATDERTIKEIREQGLSEAELRAMWMRRVQTTPADFLRLKFAYQIQARPSP
jgi:Ca-activated chloride channel family protein